MKAVKKCFCLLFSLLMLLTAVTFTGCKKQEIIWVEYGASNGILRYDFATGKTEIQ